MREGGNRRPDLCGADVRTFPDGLEGIPRPCPPPRIHLLPRPHAPLNQFILDNNKSNTNNNNIYLYFIYINNSLTPPPRANTAHTSLQKLRTLIFF